jgi:hypothetical protein
MTKTSNIEQATSQEVVLLYQQKGTTTMKNKRVRHNHIQGRTVEVVQLSTHKTHMIHERYADLYSDYVAQQRNVYIKPKRAIKGWNRASDDDSRRNGAVRIVRAATRRLPKRQQNVLRELGM